MTTESFREIWLVDFEFSTGADGLPQPICMVAMEWRSGTSVHLWLADANGHRAPFALNAETLFVAYFASAEFGCFLALGWERPANTLDLYVEFRNATNGMDLAAGNGLPGALAFYGLPFMSTEAKEELRGLALRGGPFSENEAAALLEYCASDVQALAALFGAMQATLDVERALLRGRYMWCVAEIERTGVPVDEALLHSLRASWGDLRLELVRDLDERYGVFEDGRFRAAKFRQYLLTAGIQWPEDDRGRLCLSDEVVADMAALHSELVPLRVGRQALAQLKPEELAVGADGRSGTLLSPFRSKTGRNQPRSKRFVLGGSSWQRRLIRAPRGRSLAHVDWEQQEFGIAAALSGDSAMLEAYSSGDPYLAFAKQAGAVPPNATKQSHAAVRELFKQCALGVLFGMTAYGLATRIGKPLEAARQLLRLHRSTFPRFWDWSDAAVYSARLKGRISTTFGWQLLVTDATSDRTLRNYPMQANGADMLRLAVIFARERGVSICAPVHDALLIEAPSAGIQAAVTDVRAAMALASQVVLDGVELRTEIELVASEAHFPCNDPAGIWSLVERATSQRVASAPSRERQHAPALSISMEIR